jgi:hypothetical protein
MRKGSRWISKLGILRVCVCVWRDKKNQTTKRLIETSHSLSLFIILFLIMKQKNNVEVCWITLGENVDLYFCSISNSGDGVFKYRFVVWCALCVMACLDFSVHVSNSLVLRQVTTLLNNNEVEFSTKQIEKKGQFFFFK